MALQELASAWVRANCPRGDVQANFVQSVDEAMRQEVGVAFLIGKDLTRTGRPFLVHFHCGELFAFQLTEREAERLKVKAQMLVASQGCTRHNHQRRPRPPVELLSVEIGGAEPLGQGSKIECLVEYRSGSHWELPLAIQVACGPSGSTNVRLFHHFLTLPHGERALRFSLPTPEFLLRPEPELAGPLPMFVQIGIMGEPESNAPVGPNSPGAMLVSLGLPSTRPPQPERYHKPRLGEQFTPPTPTPLLMTPEAIAIACQAGLIASPPPTDPPGLRFRGISDIRAVLVEIA